MLRLERQCKGEYLWTSKYGDPVQVSVELGGRLLAPSHGFVSDHVVLGAFGRPLAPYTLEMHLRETRWDVSDLPDGFSFHDVRHYFARLLISPALDVNAVQSALRHGSAKNTLDTYGHMLPDRNEVARAAVTEVLAARAENTAD